MEKKVAMSGEQFMVINAFGNLVRPGNFMLAGNVLHLSICFISEHVIVLRLSNSG